MAEEDIASFFDEAILERMRNDIKLGIKQGSHYLTALGLASYTEYLGSIKGNRINEKGQTRHNYNVFLYDLNSEYRKIDEKLQSNKRDSLYRRIRCGLFHEYFIKKKAEIKPRSKHSQGIYYDEDKNKIVISLCDYLNEFINAVNELKKECTENPPYELRKMARYWKFSNMSSGLNIIRDT
ncbi:MAG: hypothetical protein ACLFVP_06800 [Candidatus Bathyarchaeia archaeon]